MSAEASLYEISTASLLQKYARLAYRRMKPKDQTRVYDASTDAINLKKMTPYEREQVYTTATNELIEMVKSGTISFPFQRFFRPAAEILFKNIQTTSLEVTHPKNPFRMHSYHPKYSSYLPPKFRGQGTIVHASAEVYDTADVLSDLFMEDVRLQAKRYDQTQSTLECWTEVPCLRKFMREALNNDYVTPKTLRSSIYKSHAETKAFSPTWAKTLLQLAFGPNVNLSGKKWLDISAGWGDRLIAAMAMDMDYVGFDPNIELEPGHSQLIHMFGNPARHRVIYEPFEKADIPPGPYDVIQTSPPYFTVEEYVPGQVGQSIVSYPNYIPWMVWFLFASLSKAWSHLKPGGFLILHLGDTHTVMSAEATNIYIENYLPGASWEGLIGVSSEAGYPRPVWVWKKVLDPRQRKIWEPESHTQTNRKGPGPYEFKYRTLLNTYPELQSEIVKFSANLVTENYGARLTNASIIRENVALRLPEISISEINTLLDDNLLITSLLESTSAAEDVIANSEHVIDVLSQFVMEVHTDPSIKMDALKSLYNADYEARVNNGTVIREHIGSRYPHLDPNVIALLFGDDLMLASLLEVLEFEGTMTWITEMIHVAIPR